MPQSLVCFSHTRLLLAISNYYVICDIATFALEGELLSASVGLGIADLSIAGGEAAVSASLTVSLHAPNDATNRRLWLSDLRSYMTSDVTAIASIGAAANASFALYNITTGISFIDDMGATSVAGALVPGQYWDAYTLNEDTTTKWNLNVSAPLGMSETLSQSIILLTASFP